MRLPIALLLLGTATAPLLAGDHAGHWSYEGSGGPSHWATLESDYATCAGKSQSPVEIRTHDAKADDLPALVFHYRPAPLRIVDNGHSIQLNYDPGSALLVAGTPYQLIQFHFHRPSEEVVDGKRFAMVVHLVHRDARGRLLVVAVPLELGRGNALIETLWRNLPSVKAKEIKRADITIDAASLLPATHGYYAYNGSLTTPPCSEGVRWAVLKTPVSISRHEADIFAARYADNARPIQPLNGRQILSSK